MPYIPPNSQQYYVIVTTSTTPESDSASIRQTYAATVPGGPLDSLHDCQGVWLSTFTDWSLQWWTSGLHSFVFSGGIWTPGKVAVLPFSGGGPFLGWPEAIPYPEAALILRRVGAGSPPHVRGRMYLPGIAQSMYTDFPKGRRVNNLDSRIVAMMSAMTAQAAAMAPNFVEVLVSRTTGGAWPVTSYECPTRVGRVWSRAGYPHR